MTQFGNGFEGQTAGVTITPANSSASGDGFSTVSANGTIVYDDQLAAHGTRSGKITPVAGSPSGLTYGSAGSPVGGAAWAARACFRMATLPTEANPLIQVTSDGSARMTSIGIEQTGKIQIRDSATVLSTSASPNLFPVNTWITLELWATLSATAAEFHARAYAGDSPAAANIISQFDTSAANTGAAAPRTIVFGKFLSTNWATAFNVDDLLIDNAATGYLGPAAPFAKAVVTGAPAHIPRSDGSGGEAYNITVSANNVVGSTSGYTYAVVIEKCATADFASGVTTVVDTRNAYQASPTFTYAPTSVGYYRVTPYALPPA